MTTYMKTIIKVSIHAQTESPIFGESSTHISLEDEAGGIYLKLEQCNDNSENGCVTFENLEHLEAVVAAAKELLENSPK
jgi:hypothetical protein